MLYHGFWLDNNRLALATLYGCLIVLDREGKIIQKFDKNSGLQDETVLYAYANPENPGQVPLWFALNIGISKAEINSPIRLFDEKSGLNGTINDITRFQGKLYVATSSGVYYMDENKQRFVQFKKVENINTQCWSFLSFNAGGEIEDKLLIGTIRGLYEITEKGKGKLLDESILNNLQGRTGNIMKIICRFTDCQINRRMQFIVMKMELFGWESPLSYKSLIRNTLRIIKSLSMP